MELHRGGAIKSVRLSKENVVGTPSGPLVPAWRWDDARRKLAPSLTFHPDGSLKGLRLEDRQTVGLGDRPGLEGPKEMAAERLAWHPGGALRRIFPLDGRLGPWWTLKDERALAEPLEIATEALGRLGPVTIASLGFYGSGALRSLALWPGETVTVPATGGEFEARLGLEFWEGGRIRSLEPARPVKVMTPLGEAEAFDPAAVAITGEGNSLGLNPDGSVAKVAAMAELVWSQPPDPPETFSPAVRPHPLVDGAVERLPLRLSFGEGFVLVGAGGPGAEPRRLDLGRGEGRLRPLAGSRVRGVSLNLRMRVLGRGDD
jgi:hypothetical protein